MVKRFYCHIMNVVLLSFSFILLDSWDPLRGDKVDAVAALREQAAASRLISSGHKAAALVFLAGGFTWWMLRDRSWGGEY